MTDDLLLWQGPPPPPDPDVVVGDISCQGILALTLREALFELQNHSSSATSVSDESDAVEDAVPNLPLTGEAADSIMKALGDAIVKSQQHDNNCALDPKSTTGSVSSPAAAPAAVLRGRLDHSNRFGPKWRMMVVDAELVPASMSPSLLASTTMNSRRRQRSPSRFESSTQQPLKLARLEILAYNDVE